MKESQIAVMEEFIDNVKILINTLGYKVLEPLAQKDSASITVDDEILYITSGSVNATGKVTAEGFGISIPIFSNSFILFISAISISIYTLIVLSRSASYFYFTYFPFLILLSSGFSAPAGIAQHDPIFIAPGIRFSYFVAFDLTITEFPSSTG